jgi:cobalt-zinc-cadmium efflux system outer membrane protein
VDVTLGYDHWPISATNTQGTGNSYTIGISLPLFLYDSGRGPQQRARADARAAASDLDSREASAERELATATQQASQARAIADRYRAVLLPAAEQILSAEELAYQRGAAGLLELLDARRNQRQVAVAAIGAERDAVAASGRLQLALGRDPVASPAQPIPTPEATP